MFDERIMCPRCNYECDEDEFDFSIGICYDCVDEKEEREREERERIQELMDQQHSYHFNKDNKFHNNTHTYMQDKNFCKHCEEWVYDSEYDHHYHRCNRCVTKGQRNYANGSTYSSESRKSDSNLLMLLLFIGLIIAAITLVR